MGRAGSVTEGLVGPISPLLVQGFFCFALGFRDVLVELARVLKKLLGLLSDLNLDSPPLR